MRARTRTWLAVAAVALVGLVLTVLAAGLTAARADLERDSRFDQQADRIAADAHRRLRQPVDWLQGLAAAGAVVDGRQDGGWLRRALAARPSDPVDTIAGIPGVALVGWALPAGAGPGVPAAFQVVDTVGRADPGAPARGDRLDDPSIAEAVQAAVRAGRPVLVDAPSRRAATTAPGDHLVVAPVHGGPGHGVRGFLFATVSASELLAHLRAVAVPGLLVDLADQSADGVWRPLGQPSGASGRLPALRRLDVPVGAGDHDLMLSVRATAAFDAAAHPDRTASVLAVGLVLTALAAGLTGWLVAGRARAERLARTLSVDVERLAAVVRHSGDAIALADRDGRIDWVNEGFERLLGLSGDAVAGRRLGSVFAPDPASAERSAIDTRVEAVLAGEREDVGGAADEGLPAVRSRLEVAVALPDGRVVWTELDIQPRCDADGAVVGLVAVAVDIRERKVAEQTLHAALADAGRLAEELGVMANVARHAANGIVLTDAEGRVTWVNPGFERMSGWTLDEIMGCKPGRMLQCERTDPAETARLREAIARHERCTAELLNRTKDGREYWVRLDIQPLVGWDGGHAGFMAIETDVTERRRLLDDLRDGMALVEAVFEAIPLPVVMKGADGRLQRVNAAAARFVGRPREALLGRTTAEVLAGEQGRLQDGEDAELLRGPGSRRYELTVTRRTGEPAHFLVSKRTVLDADARAVGIVTALVDLTAQHEATRASQEAREAAEAANRAKSAFLATMSHEIRTPMNGVIGTAELLARDRRLDAGQSELVGTILASATSLLGLLDDILDFSKIEAGRLELESTTFGLTDLAEGVCQGLAPMAAQRGVELHVFLRPGLADRRVGDPTRLRQVLVNLVGNAVKFSARDPDRPGHVSLRVEPDAEGRVRFEVADDGIGMDADTVSRLFRPFTQAEVSTTRRFGGTGLGLAICRRLADLMGGAIAVESRPGEGSVFRVTLPLPVAADAAAMAAADEALPSLAGVDCLLAAWPPVPADDLAAWLVQDGARVHRLAGPEALAACLADLAQGHGHGPDPAPPRVLLLPAEPGKDAIEVPPGVAVVRIGRGRRGTARPRGPHDLQVDLLRRVPFLQAVAAAAGRATLPVVAPPVDPQERDERVAPPTDEEARAAGQWILVAEDDATNRRVVTRQLALLGFAAQVVEDGEQALAAWVEHRHALVLTDLHMPRMDGLDLTRAIRTHEARLGLPRTPVLALTANALKGEAARAREAGMDDYLTKPIPIVQLRTALNQWMPAPRPGVPAGARPTADVENRAEARPVEPVVDLGVLVELVGDDAATLAELVEEYRRTAGRQRARLVDAWRRGEPSTVAAAAHTLKSASRSVGARALAAACEAVEEAARAEPAELPAALVTLFEERVDAVLRALPTPMETTG